MLFTTTTARRVLAALAAFTVLLSAVTVGGIAQTDSGNDDASAGDAEPNDSPANAAPVVYGEQVNATLSSPSDVDYYAVNVTAGDAVLPRLQLKDPPEGGAVEVDIVAPDGEVTTEIQNDVLAGPHNDAGPATLGGGDTAYTGDVAESNGTYYVRVRKATNLLVGGTETNASDTYRYSLTVNRSAVDEYEPNENGTTATPIEVGETLDAAFAGYDSDVYAVNVTAGDDYTVEVSHPTELGDRYATKALYVYANRSQPVDDPAAEFAEDGKSPYDFHRPNGTAVAVSPIRTAAPSVSFTATENGTYYIQIVQNKQNYDLISLDDYAITVTRTGGTPDDGADPLPDGGDADADGLTNAREAELGTDPRDADTDNDSLSDGREVTELGTDPLSADTDGDGLTDDCELVNEMDPTDPDTDGDGTPDGDEV